MRSNGGIFFFDVDGGIGESVIVGKGGDLLLGCCDREVLFGCLGCREICIVNVVIMKSWYFYIGGK